MAANKRSTRRSSRAETIRKAQTLHNVVNVHEVAGVPIAYELAPVTPIINIGSLLMVRLCSVNLHSGRGAETVRSIDRHIRVAGAPRFGRWSHTHHSDRCDCEHKYRGEAQHECDDRATALV
jgi:hypothetical protein